MPFVFELGAEPVWDRADRQTNGRARPVMRPIIWDGHATTQLSGTERDSVVCHMDILTL